MIGKLRGTVDDVGDGTVVVDVGGVGYLAHCSARTLSGLPARGEPVTLFVETHVREDMIRLYGFGSAAERAWFAMLQSVQGVGAKVALGIQSTLDANELAGALATGDTAALARSPGVGAKLAQRIAGELRGKAPEGTAAASPAAARSDAASDAVSAVTNLGYPRHQAAVAVDAAAREAGDGAEAPLLIRLALKHLSRAA